MFFFCKINNKRKIAQDMPAINKFILIKKILSENYTHLICDKEIFMKLINVFQEEDFFLKSEEISLAENLDIFNFFCFLDSIFLNNKFILEILDLLKILMSYEDLNIEILEDLIDKFILKNVKNKNIYNFDAKYNKYYRLFIVENLCYALFCINRYEINIKNKDILKIYEFIRNL
jgi:hypothetical protein